MTLLRCLGDEFRQLHTQPGVGRGVLLSWASAPMAWTPHGAHGETGSALKTIQLWRQVDHLGILGGEGRTGVRGCELRMREREKERDACF